MTALQTLPNIGKVQVKKLNAIGIHTPEQLINEGTEQVFRKLLINDPGACLSELSAIEGAIRGIRWHDLPQETKLELKELHERLQSER